MKLLIKNGHIVCSKSGIDGVFDILVENNLIKEIKKGIDQTGCEIIDAGGKYVLPGLIDAHCHLRDPGLEYKEDIVSGTRSAASGGFTSVACMPNTSPVADNKAVIEYIKLKARTEGAVNVFPIGAISKGLKGEELAEIGDLKEAGAVAISDDGKPVQNSALMKKALMYSSDFDIPIISHCEDLDLAAEGVMNEGKVSTMLGLKGIPAAAEEAMVSRDIILSEYTGVPIHIAHVSTALSVHLVRDAKKRGVKVTAETCPHYFSLTESACEGFNTLAKVNPPLRTENDRLAVIEGLKDGTIDIIVTDHAPHHIDEKNVEFALAANGLVGFETALPLAITYLVNNNILTMAQLVEKMCSKPAEILNIPKGRLEVGRSADIIIVDLNKEITVDINSFKSKSKNSPFNGFKLDGAVTHTIVGGKIIVKDGELLV